MASISTPAIAVIGLPGLPAALTACGYECLADGSPSVVAAAVRKLATEERPYVVIVAGNDSSLRAWISVQVAQGRPVLIATSDQLPFGEAIQKTRTISLPATVDQIMAVFGAPPAKNGLGEVAILADGTVASSETDSSDDDPFNQPLFVDSSHQPSAKDDQQNPFATPADRDQEDLFVPADRDQEDLFVPADRDQEDLFVPAENSEPITAQPLPIEAPNNPFVTPVIPDKNNAPFITQPPAEEASNPFITPVVPDENSEPLTVQLPLAPVETVPTNPQPQSPFRVQADVVVDTVPDIFRPVPVATKTGRKRSPAIISFAGKGGVGKTTIALALAERAVIVGGIERVILIDANRGQGDVRKYTRIGGHLPSIYDAAISGNPSAAVVDPKQLSQARPGLPDLHIGIVLAPTSDQADPTIVTSDVYGSVIDYARSVADLVVLDTQIVEAVDTSGLIDGVVVPLLVTDAWGLGISDSSMPGVSNLLSRLKLFQSRNVNPARMMIALNRLAVDSGINPSAVTQLMASYGTWVGSVTESSAMSRAFEIGQVPGAMLTDDPDMAEMSALLNKILHRVTGLDVFVEHDQQDMMPKKSKSRWRLRR
ncbi:MAG: hypothetical protein ACYDEP_02540 [Acidimicrobiales bacterium]